MLALIAGYLGSAAGGAILKGVFGILSNVINNRHESHMQNQRLLAQKENKHVEKFENADTWTKHTRRTLAYLMCGTFCIIL